MQLRTLIYNFKISRLFKKQDKVAKYYDKILTETIKEKKGNEEYQSIIGEGAPSPTPLATKATINRRGSPIEAPIPELHVRS